MLSGLKLINLPPSKEFEGNLISLNTGNVFVLRTCQRTLMVGFNEGPKNLIQKAGDLQLVQEEFLGDKAYEFLLETICGLKSRILGENEIVHQFKEAYNAFLEHDQPNRHIQGILEKLFKDAKKIRTQHLRELGLQTYAGIVRKIMMDKLAGTNFDTPVLILGSGQLAEDIIKICYRKFNLTISARNEKKVAALKDQYPIETLSWFQPNEISNYPIIINTIGTSDILFDHDFFQMWKIKSSGNLINGSEVFIDLAEPSPIDSLYQVEDGLWRLQDIFAQGEKHSQKREEKLKEAHLAIAGVSQKRIENYTFQIPFGWEELQFA